MNTEVSFFDTNRSTQPRTINVQEFYRMVRDGHWRDLVELVRHARDESERKMLKGQLSAITPAGVFSGGHKKSNFQTHSGIMVADFDHIEPQISQVRLALSRSPYVLAHFLSPSGTGVKAFFRIPPNRSTHRAMFDEVRSHALEISGCEIDESGKDISRLCYGSWDPNIVLRQEVLEMPIPPESAPTPVEELTPCTQTAQTAQTAQVSEWWKGEILTAPHTTNAAFFNMGRTLLAVEKALGRKLSPNEVRTGFSNWFKEAPPEFLFEDQDTYFLEFGRIRSYVTTPISDSAVSLAWEKALTEPLPPESHLFDNDAMKRLVALCFQLARPRKGEFFLGGRSAASLLGVSPRQAANWLRGLCGNGFLEVVQTHPHATRKATVYRWKGQL